MSDQSVVYTPAPSLRGFLTSEKFISLVVGPIGSAKTTAGIMKIAYHAKQMAPDANGIRKSRAVWVRNTREQLRDTSIPDFLQWFPDGPAGEFKKTEYKFTLRFDDVECEVLFRGLDDSNDVRRLLSLQVSFGIIEEFREINPEIYTALQGRLGRYPPKMINGVGCVKDDGTNNAHLWGMTNPPDVDSFWELLLSDPADNVDVFFQPSGLSPMADWTQWLPDGYYDNLAEGKTQDWIDVYIHAKFGRSLAGRPVWTSFQPDFHVAKETLNPIRSNRYPLVVGMDFGLNPSVTINQIDPKGRLLTYEAMTSDGMGALRFVQEVLKPKLAERFSNFPVTIIGDPAGINRSQTDERTVFDILKREGFTALPARTNKVAARISAVDFWLTRQIDGGPAHLIDPAAVPLLKAMRGGYRYKKKTDGEYGDKPEKNASSHIADAHQYACLHAGGVHTGGVVSSRRAQPVVRAKAVGWT